MNDSIFPKANDENNNNKINIFGNNNDDEFLMKIKLNFLIIKFLFY